MVTFGVLIFGRSRGSPGVFAYAKHESGTSFTSGVPRVGTGGTCPFYKGKLIFTSIFLPYFILPLHSEFLGTPLSFAI